MWHYFLTSDDEKKGMPIVLQVLIAMVIAAFIYYFFYRLFTLNIDNTPSMEFGAMDALN